MPDQQTKPLPEAIRAACINAAAIVAQPLFAEKAQGRPDLAFSIYNEMLARFETTLS